jgi:hypothetical protein
MMRTVVPLLAVACGALSPLTTTGCARHRPVATTPSTDSTTAPAPVPPREPVTLRVTNSNWSDVRIYLTRGAMWVRLGLVTTNSTVEFIVPVEFVTSPGNVTLVADPVAGRRSWTTTLPAVTPGDEFELVVESFLQYSHLVVR